METSKTLSGHVLSKDGPAAAMMAAFALEGVAAYPGPMTREMVVQAGAHWKDFREAFAQASACAAEAGWSQTAIHSLSTGGRIAEKRPATAEVEFELCRM